MPRWAGSAYDRGLEEIHDFLDLLWGFSFLDLPNFFRFVKKKHHFGEEIFLIFAEGCFVFGGWLLVVGRKWLFFFFFFFGVGAGFYVRYTCYQPLKT